MLAPYVHNFGGFVEDGCPVAVSKMLPTCFVPLIIVLDRGFTLHDPDSGQLLRPLPHSFIAGLQQTPTAIGSAGRALCMQVDFTLPGARRFLGLDMHEITGQVLDLSVVLGRAAGELEEQLADAGDWHSRFDILDAALCQRLQRAPDEHPLVSAALQHIRQSAGTLRIESLASTLGCSRKHLATLFKREVGLTPKSVARIVRFESALVRLQAGHIRSLTDLAFACGYSDQAHFNRECRNLTGDSPTNLLNGTH